MAKEISASGSFHAAWLQLETVIRALDDAKTPDALLHQATDILAQITDKLDTILLQIPITPWPQPTADPPDLETLEQWMWDDAGCEATDACWVEVDGRCPHGFPSWLLYWGLV